MLKYETFAAQLCCAIEMTRKVRNNHSTMKERVSVSKYLLIKYYIGTKKCA